MSESGKTKHNDAACRQRGLCCSSISHLDGEVQHEVTLNLHVAGCQWAAPEIRWYHDPLKENCPPILATTTRTLSLNNYSTTHMAKRSRSWKNRMIKTGDSVMVGGQPTDIVIPCDSIYVFYFLFYLSISVLWAQPELEKALYDPHYVESLFSLTTVFRS